MPNVATHRYDPALGVCPNLCALPDYEALQVLDRLRSGLRPTLKLNYLARRRVTEQWLSDAATGLLGRRLEQHPAYFFLGDFSHQADSSRPATLMVPILELPAHAITLTLGDSMSVAFEAGRRVYKLDQIAALFRTGDAVSRFGLSDRYGFQPHFIELQLWNRSSGKHLCSKPPSGYSEEKTCLTPISGRA